MAVIIVNLKITRTVNPTEEKKLEDFLGESLKWVKENIRDKLPKDASMDNPHYAVEP